MKTVFASVIVLGALLAGCDEASVKTHYNQDSAQNDSQIHTATESVTAASGNSVGGSSHSDHDHGDEDYNSDKSPAELEAHGKEFYKDTLARIEEQNRIDNGGAPASSAVTSQ